MAVFGNITYHRLERLSMYVVIMPVNKIYTFISGKIIKGLLYRQPKLSPKFSDENQRPLYFLSIAIHKSLSYLMRVCDIILNYTRRVHVFIHSFQLMHCHCLWPPAGGDLRFRQSTATRNLEKHEQEIPPHFNRHRQNANFSMTCYIDFTLLYNI